MVSKRKYRIYAFIIDLFLCLLGITIFASLLLNKSLFNYIFVDKVSEVTPYNLVRILELGLISEIYLAIYLSVIPSTSHGQTIGMKMFRIRLVSENNKDCTLGQYYAWGIICNTLLVFVTTGLYFIINFAVFLFRSDKASLTNLITKTKVIDKLD